MHKLSKHSSRRRFSTEFKKARVKEYEKGLVTVGEMSKQYHVSATAIYKWLRKYSYFYQNKVVVVEQASSNSERLKQKDHKIESLEKLLGQKQISIEYLEMLLAKASEHFGVDIKKNFDIKP